ncbi:unnamed protein product [Rotaria magnacalcarata]|uniref:Reverse transcriptase/retrotransposon-derived protein RNase H-like domain-containing protein n=2 Tax=Rotaria magnacalcarata TaxID=392030 RepID=A0A820EJS9_9BILA|nr:unnamed protein product [Rotaria magnacalcarata]
MRLHSPNCATIQKPLSALTGKSKVLLWNSEAEIAFNTIKKLLVSPQLLAYPNYNSTEPLKVHVDSSLTGAGAILSQKQSGVQRPIAFISTSWGQAEQDYASTARELAGLRWAVKKLAPFLRDLNKASKFELKIMNQEGINLIPEAIKAFSNIYNCQVVVFEKRTHPIYYGEDSLPNTCYLNSYNSFHYNLLINKVKESTSKLIKKTSPSPIILPEGRVENELNSEIKELSVKSVNNETIENKNINLLSKNNAKITFNKWTREEIQIMQKTNDQLKLLKNFVLTFAPGESRIIKCRHTPDLILFLKHINNIFVHENILVREIDIGLETHRLLPIITLNAFIQGAIDIHISRSHCGQHVL